MSDDTVGWLIFSVIVAVVLVMCTTIYWILI